MGTIFRSNCATPPNTFADDTHACQKKNHWYFLWCAFKKEKKSHKTHQIAAFFGYFLPSPVTLIPPRSYPPPPACALHSITSQWPSPGVSILAHHHATFPNPKEERLFIFRRLTFGSCSVCTPTKKYPLTLFFFLNTRFSEIYVEYQHFGGKIGNHSAQWAVH